MNTTAEHVQRADRYFGHMIGIVLNESNGPTPVIETERRGRPEEGFSDAWPLLALKKGSRCWVSASATALSTLPMAMRNSLRGTQQEFALHSAIVADLRDAKGIFDKLSAYIFLPTIVPLAPYLAGRIKLQLIRESVQLWKGGIIPEESIKDGTAFGVYLDDQLVSWAEATPLPTITGQFGVMLVGIETHPEHRGKGYAKAALACLTQEVCKRDMTPIYFCGKHNKASQKTVLACGYSLYGEWWRFRESDLKESNKSNVCDSQ